MILIQCTQGSPEWLAARAGVITASRFRDAVDKTQKGAPTARAIAYAAEVAIELISGAPSDDGYTTWQMRRGSDLEPAARMEYESYTANLATEAGVALTDDRVFGYSTDGFVGDDGVIEIKCPASPEKVISMWRDRNFDDYMHQIQGGMWITGRTWCDFVMYAPQLANAGKELFYQRIQRDDEFIDAMVSELKRFRAMVEANVNVLREEVTA